MNTINRTTFQALTRRLTNKEIAHQFNVSYSTVSRWKNSTGNIRTKRDYSETVEDLRTVVLKHRGADSINEKKSLIKKLRDLEPDMHFGLDKKETLHGQFAGENEWKGINATDYYYEWDNFDKASFRDKLNEEIFDNTLLGKKSQAAIIVEYKDEHGNIKHATTKIRTVFTGEKHNRNINLLLNDGMDLKEEYGEKIAPIKVYLMVRTQGDIELY